MPFANAPGAKLYYETTGSGTPILFVHETSADLRSWEPQVRWFSRFHQCITYNARGYPPSERGELPATHDYHRLAEDIGVVMDAAEVKSAFVVGHSMGAYVASHFALNHPNRMLGVVLCGLGAGSDEPEAFRTSTLAMAQTLRTCGMDSMMEQMGRGPNRVQLLNKDSRGFVEFLEHLRGLDAVGIANILQFCHSARPPIYEFEEELRALKVPTLIAVGDEDTPCIGPALFLKRTISAAGLWICARTGHAVNLEEPALFNSAVQSFIYAVQNGAWRERDPRSFGQHVLDPVARPS